MVKRGLILGGVLALFGCASAYAEGANISIDVSNASIQLTVPSSANIILNPSTSSAFGDAEIQFSVASNNPTGYRVLMSVPQTEMLHSSIATANIPTLESTTTEANFPVNKWGYKTTGDYNPIKLNNEDPSWEYNGPTNNQSHSLTLAAKIDNATPAGTYTNTLTFQAVANPNAPRDTIIFNANNANATGTMANQAAFRGEPTVLNANEFVVEGYYFTYWNTRADGRGVSYKDLDTFINNTSFGAATTTINLYAQWEEDTGQGSGYVGKTLQDAYEQAYVSNPGQFPKDGGGTKHGMYVPHKTNGVYDGTYFEATSSADYEGIPAKDLRYAIQDIGLTIDGVKICDYATVLGSEAYVLDLRDYTSYHIIKAKDGRCWMTDNLALDLVDSFTRSRMDETNTNAPAAAISNLLNGNNRQGSYWAEQRVYNSITNSTEYPFIYNNEKNQTSNDSLDIADQVKLGVYYNYCAASAGTYCGGSEIGIPNQSSAVDATYDICPTGWRMPTGGPVSSTGYNAGGGEGQILIDAYNASEYGNDSSIAKKTLRLALAGIREDGYGALNKGVAGIYWSSTAYDQSSTTFLDMYHLGVTRSDSIYYMSANGYRNYHRRTDMLSVRCIAK